MKLQLEALGDRWNAPCIWNLHHPGEGERLAPGEILAAPSTDPGWTPLFMRTPSSGKVEVAFGNGSGYAEV